MLEKNIRLNGRTILIIEVVDFIGSNLSTKLLQEDSNIKIVGIENMNIYYDVCHT